MSKRILVLDSGELTLAYFRAYSTEVKSSSFDFDFLNLETQDLSEFGQCFCELILFDCDLLRRFDFDFFLNVQLEKPRVPILVLYNFGDFPLISKLLKKGAVDFYQKEFNKPFELLELRIERALSLFAERESIFQQQKLASMGEVISQIAHQWRQPLGLISTTASGEIVRNKLFDMEALNQYKERLSESDKKILEEFLERFSESEEAFDLITKIVTKLSEMITDFRKLTISSQEAEDLNLFKFIQTTLSTFQGSFLNFELSLLSENENLVVKTFPDALGHVLINLLNNAKDVLKERGIEEPKIEIRVKEKKKKIEIQVEDNAGGVPEEHLSKVFDPFFTTKGERGTGIGLYMSYNLMTQQCKGEIFVKNTKNGACFTLLLPKGKNDNGSKDFSASG